MVEELRGIFEVVQAALFVGLGIVAIARWWRRRGTARAWLAATFGVLGAITLAGLVLPEQEPGTPITLVTRILLVVLVLFPYLLFRFAATFRPRSPVLEALAAGGTLVVELLTFALRDLPAEGEPWTGTFATWAVLLLVDWVALTIVVAAQLWRGGHGQPTVSRRRMRVLSLASLGLALSLVISAGSGSGTQSDAQYLLTQLLVFGAAPLFLIGFAPPQFVLASWRRPELEELRAAEEVLLQALSPTDVGRRLLPHVTRIIGGQCSALFDAEGAVLGVDGIEEDAAAAFFDDPTNQREVITLPVRAGRMVVGVNPYTPYFARSEAELLTRLATFTDLALSRAELSERERQTAVELQVANEAMREFLAIASHDLRTPVTVIKGFAATLEQEGDGLPEEQRRQYLAAVRRHADHLGVIIDDLLTTSRLDAGVLEPNPTQVELRPFLERVVGDLRDSLHADLVVPDGARAWVDEEHLQRMVTNYLVNALRYGAPPITVEVRPAGEMVELVVADRGAGVPDDFQARVFDKFARGDKRLVRDNSGTGLGLAIVRGLARAAGGDAWYEPNEPSGACFGLRLPASPPS